jgi:hypothetical protein
MYSTRSLKKSAGNAVDETWEATLKFLLSHSSLIFAERRSGAGAPQTMSPRNDQLVFVGLNRRFQLLRY